MSVIACTVLLGPAASGARDSAYAEPAQDVAAPLPAQPFAAGPEPAGQREAKAEVPARRFAGRLEGAYGPERRAQKLYVDGVEELDAGRRAWAQRTFEALIAQFPESRAAVLARRQLGALSGSDRGRSPPKRRGGSKAAEARPAAAVRPVLGRSSVWEQELRRNAAIQSKLRMEAGDRVFFALGSAILGSRARVALSAQAQWLKRWHEFEAAIEGHADEPGTAEENLKLSKERAEAVRQRLVEEGVEASRLAVVAMGNTQRIAPCADAACGAQNRRVITLVFASGARQRLGLSTPRTTADAVQLPKAGAFVPVGTGQQPAAAEQVGVAR